MKNLLIVFLLMVSLQVKSQPGDPSGDPDSVLTAFPKENVFDSLATVVKQGKQYLILYRKDKPLIVYRREKKVKVSRSKGVSFY